jgi:hypothetical protein
VHDRGIGFRSPVLDAEPGGGIALRIGSMIKVRRVQRARTGLTAVVVLPPALLIKMAITLGNGRPSAGSVAVIENNSLTRV